MERNSKDTGKSDEAAIAFAALQELDFMCCTVVHRTQQYPAFLTESGLSTLTCGQSSILRTMRSSPLLAAYCMEQ